jgi:hypothetical protein
LLLAEAGEASLGRQRVGQQFLHAWLSGLDNAHLAMVIDTFTALRVIAIRDGFFKEASHD